MKRSELLFMFLLLPVDIAMIIASFIAAYYLRTQLNDGEAASNIGLLYHFRYSLYLLPGWVVVFALNGLYDPSANRASFGSLTGVFMSNCVIMLFLGIAGFTTNDQFFSGSMILYTLILSVLFVATGRMVLNATQRYYFGRGIGHKNVLLIGSGSATAYVAEQLRKYRPLAMRVVGAIGDGPKAGYRLPYLGDLAKLDETISQHTIDEVIVAEKDLPEAELARIIRVCSDRTLAVDLVPAELCLLSTRVHSDEIGSMPFLKVQTIPLDGWGRILKRAGDLTFSFTFLVLLAPLLGLIALIQKLTSRGPVFYAQDRIGRDGQHFRVYKFRSMYVDQCDFTKEGSKWSTAADERTRITPFGRFLRRSNLDELPQLWNIFIGNMSLVGPRPEQPTHVLRFTAEIPDYYRRHRVKSGLTGWAQVNGLKGDTSIPERVKYDMHYIENWSLWLDLRIVFMTVFVVLHEMLGGKVEYRAQA